MTLTDPSRASVSEVIDCNVTALGLICFTICQETLRTRCPGAENILSEQVSSAYARRECASSIMGAGISYGASLVRSHCFITPPQSTVAFLPTIYAMHTDSCNKLLSRAHRRRRRRRWEL
ncbi:hypothetical protein C8Q79DRAFT_994887 [Trametes meyenii]|nr:hypothetical protein C8Q79DRAFT_994887 [Trametes meyenii]